MIEIKLIENFPLLIGRMISGNKSHYTEIHPDNFAVFNANLCTKLKGKIWYGDLDLTRDAGKLAVLASQLDEDIYVLREMDARFDTEEHPRFENAVAIMTSAGNLMDMRKVRP
jgi:hypothetical protein